MKNYLFPDQGLRRRSLLVGLSLAAGELSVCAWEAKAASGATTILDARGRRIEVGNPQRMVTIGGTVTETLYDFGLQSRIVGVDTTSTWPVEALKDKKNVGYMRMLSAEGILSLKPDIIIAMNDSGPPGTIDQLIASSVPIVFVDSKPTADAVVDRTTFLANILSVPEQGDKLVATINDGFKALSNWRQSHVTTPRKVLLVLRMQNGRPMVAGHGSAADGMITLAGARNVAAEIQGYKVINDEALISLAPDVILMMDQGANDIKTSLMTNNAFLATPAGRNKAFVAMEGEKMLGFGPRTPQAGLELAQLIFAAGKA